MAVTVSLDVELEKGIKADKLLSLFYEIGWDCVNTNGEVFYLPLGDNDYDWQQEKISKKSFCMLVEEKIKRNETVGVSLYWKKSDIGVNLLIFQQDAFSLMLNINRKLLNEGKDYSITNVNWYLKEIVLKLEEKGLQIGGLTFSEYR